MQNAKSDVAAGPEVVFHDYLRAGRFMIQRSRSSGRYVFYPRLMAPGTGVEDLEWVEAAGTGTVYAITVNRGREESYNIALIELDEGVRMMSRVEGVETLPIGSRVTAHISGSKESPFVVFTPVTKEA